MNDPRRGVCTINSGEPFTPALEAWRDPYQPGVWDDPTLYNFRVPCPFYFDWVEDAGSVVAQIVIDTVPYTQPGTVNNYHGLQTNIPIGDSYAGISFDNDQMTPRAETIEFAEFDYKATYCYGDKADDRVQHGVFHYYTSFYNQPLGRGFTLAFDFGFFRQPQGGTVEPVYIQRESDLGGPQTEDYRNHFHVHLNQLGALPDGVGATQDTSATCSASADSPGSMSSLPWTKVRVPVGATIRNLVAMGVVQGDVVAGAKYVGGIIAGPEHWGRVKSAQMLKNHTLLAKLPVQPVQPARLDRNTTVPEGKFRLARDAADRIYYSNGTGGYCRYVTYAHAGVESVLDVQRILAEPPVALGSGLCPGAETFGDLPELQDSGVYPAGQFRTREEGLSWIYYSNGADAFCRYVTPRHAGQAGANSVTTVYDHVPRNMRHDGLCSGAAQFFIP